MATTGVSADRRREVHTEVRAPMEEVLARIVSFIFGVIVAFLALRFVLELFGANAQAGFVRLVYTVSDVFMVPFNAVFRTERVSGATFEWSALVAILVYSLLAWAIVALIRAISPRDSAETYEESRSEDATDHRIH
jgi:hypothetical protein